MLQRLAQDPNVLALPLQKKLRRKHIKRIAEQTVHHPAPEELAKTVETLIDDVRQQLKQDRVPHRLLHHLHASKRLLEKITADQLSDEERFQLLAEADTIHSRLALLIAQPHSTKHASSAQRWWRVRRRVSKVMGRLLHRNGPTR